MWFAGVLIPAASLQANEAQWRLCRAAMNLGNAEARLTLFGRLMNGQFPADQELAVRVNIADTAAETRAALQLVQQPFWNEWASSPQGINNLLNSLDRFAEQMEGRNPLQRAAHIRGLQGVLRSIFSVTFMSARGDARRSEGNCDRFVIDACYHFGRAAIGSNVDDREGSAYRDGAMGSMRLAIGEGLAIAMDRNGHLPFDGFRKKECCTFGTPAQWGAFQAFNPSSSAELYRVKTGELLGIIANANLLDPVCLRRQVNPWDESADEGDKSRKEDGRHKQDLINGLIARGENALSRCSFSELQTILNQLAALAPNDPRHQSLRARAAQALQREQEGLSLLREAGSYADLDRTVQTLKAAQQKFPCPKPEMNQVIASVIRDAADQQRGVDVERTRARRTAWTSAVEGILRGIEQAAAAQGGGGTFGTGESTEAGGTGTAAGTPRERLPVCACGNLNYGRFTTHPVRSPSDVRCPPVAGAPLTQAQLGSIPGPAASYSMRCVYDLGARELPLRLLAEWTISPYGAGGIWSSYNWIRSSRNAAVGVSPRRLSVPPPQCQSLCQAAWDLLRQVEPLSAAERR